MRLRASLTATAAAAATAVVVVVVMQLVSAATFCSDWSERIDRHHRFHALAHCRRSNRTQVGLANYRRVQRCAQLALQRRALAFNYAPVRRAGGRNLYERIDGNYAVEIYSDTHCHERMTQMARCGNCGSRWAVAA